METTQIFLSITLTIVGILISIMGIKNQRKARLLAMISFLLVIGLLTAQLVLQHNTAKQKETERQEFLKIKYASILNDVDIKNKIKTIIANKKMPLDLSPTNEAFGKRAAVRYFMLPCPNTLKLRYKVIDPSNYGFQNITPMIPIITRKDGQKYYLGGIAIPEDKVNDGNEVLVITKYTNGLYDIESVQLKKYIIGDLQQFFSTFGDKYNFLDE